MACRLRPLDCAVQIQLRCHAEGRTNLREVGTAAVVKDARVEVWLGPAVVEDIGGDDRREEKKKNEEGLHPWCNCPASRIQVLLYIELFFFFHALHQLPR